MSYAGGGGTWPSKLITGCIVYTFDMYGGGTREEDTRHYIES